jgi:hypothetical protein
MAERESRCTAPISDTAINLAHPVAINLCCDTMTTRYLQQLIIHRDHVMHLCIHTPVRWYPYRTCIKIRRLLHAAQSHTFLHLPLSLSHCVHPLNAERSFNFRQSSPTEVHPATPYTSIHTNASRLRSITNSLPRVHPPRYVWRQSISISNRLPTRSLFQVSGVFLQLD